MEYGDGKDGIYVYICVHVYIYIYSYIVMIDSPCMAETNKHCKAIILQLKKKKTEFDQSTEVRVSWLAVSPQIPGYYL